MRTREREREREKEGKKERERERERNKRKKEREPHMNRKGRSGRSREKKIPLQEHDPAPSGMPWQSLLLQILTVMKERGGVREREKQGETEKQKKYNKSDT